MGISPVALVVALIPLGPVPARVLSALAAAVADTFCCSIESGYVTLPVPKSAYNPSRRQYWADEVISALRSEVRSARGKVLAITEVDLYAPGLNFVFGQAEMCGRFALVSLHRLRPEFYGSPCDEDLLLARARTEAIHELGHTFGLGHCDDPHCVMFFSNSIADSDRKGCRLCPRCRSGLPAGD